jgi:DNA polymerase III delta prime subunit
MAISAEKRCIMAKEKPLTDEDMLAEQKFSAEKELNAVISSLTESGKDIIKLIRLCMKVKESLGGSAKEQLLAWDNFIRDYEFLEEDVDVNGERVKRITNALIEKAKSSSLSKEALEIYKKKDSWSFDW